MAQDGRPYVDDFLRRLHDASAELARVSTALQGALPSGHAVADQWARGPRVVAGGPRELHRPAESVRPGEVVDFASEVAAAWDSEQGGGAPALLADHAHRGGCTYACADDATGRACLLRLFWEALPAGSVPQDGSGSGAAEVPFRAAHSDGVYDYTAWCELEGTLRPSIELAFAEGAPAGQVRKLLGRLQPSIAAFSQERMEQLASFEPTSHPSRSHRSAGFLSR